MTWAFRAGHSLFVNLNIPIPMRSFLAGIALLTATSSMACDVCGIFIALQPHDRVSSFSLLYRYRHLEGPVRPMIALDQGGPKHGGHGHDGDLPGDGERYHRELYQVVEARADFWLGQRWAVMVSLPVANSYSAVDGYIMADVAGVGDPLLLVRHQLANTRCLTPDERTVHRVLAGMGVKAPVGRTDLRFQERPVAMDLQPGTGTWDLLGSAEYLVRRGRTGAATMLIGRLNGTNADNYRLGNGLSTTAEVFRRWDIGANAFLMPSLGLYHEFTGRDADSGTAVAGTGGSTFFTHAGCRVWWRAWGLQVFFQKAVAHAIGDLMVPNRERVVAGITYNLVNN